MATTAMRPEHRTAERGFHALRAGACLLGMVLALLAAGAWGQEPTAYDLNANGVAAYNAGKWKDAIALFEQSYERTPENATVRRNLCNAHQAMADSLARKGDFETASKHLELAIGVDPKNESPLVQLGSYYIKLNMVREAIARLEDAIGIAPPNTDAHELLGDAYYMDNDMKSAVEQWRWVLAVKPDRAGLKDKIDKASRQGNVEQRFQPQKSKHFNITNDRDIPYSDVRRVASALEHAYINIGRAMGNVYPENPVHATVYKGKQFKEATQVDDNVGALYDGKIRIPLLDDNGKALSDDELRTRLMHEYTHVLVHYLGGNNVPWWFNEGLAQALSDTFKPAEMTLLSKAKAEGRLFTLAALTDNQMGRLDPETLRLAYAQSHLVVDYLLKKFNQRHVEAWLRTLGKAAEPEPSFRQEYGRSFANIEREMLSMITDEAGQPQQVLATPTGTP